MSLKPNILEFHRFSFDLDEKVLAKDGKPVSLPPKALALLLVLVEQPGHIFEKEELLKRIWPDTFVEEGNLAYTIRLLRKALGDDAETPKYIETIPKRGYRFIGDVEQKQKVQAPMATIQTSILDTDDLLVGRGKEIAQITGLLETERIRLITLSGPGGTGKTRLAKEVGRRAGELFPHGVFYVGLEAITDASLVPTVIAHSLSIREGTWSDSTEALVNELRDRTALLILDNFEQILEAAAFVARLLAATGRLKILVTSREPLRLKIENEYLVPPLTLPSENANESALALGRYEAVEFFIDRARRVRPSFETFDADIRAIVGICHRLDGLPLALDLAAARAKVLSASEILAKLEHGLALLTGGAKDLPSRQQTMRAAIAWSYDLLTDIEKEVFARLSIFEVGATFEAIEAVLSADRESRTGVELLDSVTSLCDKNLLIAAGQRFRMLIVVREFAAECLSETRSREVSRAHAEYYVELSERAEPELHGAEVGKWVERLESDHDNLRAALKWSLASEPMLAARIAKALKLFWTLRGYTREAQYWYREVLKIEHIPSDIRWILLAGMANITQILGDLEGARDSFEASLAECELLGDPTLVARAIRGVGGITYLLQEFTKAKELTLRAHDISSVNGDEFGVAAALARLGDIALVMDEPEDARDLAADALAIFKRIGFLPGIASKYMNLGMAEVRCRDIDAAQTHFRESLQIADEIGDYITTSLAIMGWSFALCEKGNTADAARHLGAALRMGEDIGHFLEPAEGRLRQIYTNRLKEQMGEQAFAEAYASGRKMARSEVIRVALGGTDRRPNNVKSFATKPTHSRG